jgi:DNA-binding transcriptional MerR regulator
VLYPDTADERVLDPDATLGLSVATMEQLATDSARTWKVGALATLSGITVRTLHHYDQIGLLCPLEQTASGHRLYGPADVSRLYRILALRQLGFGLGDIAGLLDDPDWALAAMVRRHADEIERTIETATRLRTHLRAITAELDQARDATPETLFTILEDMSVLDTPIRSTTTLLVYNDLIAAHSYLSEVFGLAPGELERDESGRGVHGELFAGDQVIWLHPAGSDYQSPQQLGAVSAMTVVAVNDVDEHHATSRNKGADIISPPVDQPYGVREYGARDLEGHLWYFHAALA